MFLHVGLLVESLAAEVAGVGPGVAVDQQVGGQGAASLERLPALRTLKIFQNIRKYFKSSESISKHQKMFQILKNFSYGLLEPENI